MLLHFNNLGSNERAVYSGPPVHSGHRDAVFYDVYYAMRRNLPLTLDYQSLTGFR
jgi:hypothetical protein